MKILKSIKKEIASLPRCKTVKIKEENRQAAISESRCNRNRKRSTRTKISSANANREVIPTPTTKDINGGLFQETVAKGSIQSEKRNCKQKRVGSKSKSKTESDCNELDLQTLPNHENSIFSIFLTLISN